MATAVAETSDVNHSEEYEVIAKENGTNSLDSDFSFLQMPDVHPQAYTLTNGNVVENNSFCSKDLTEEQFEQLTAELLDFNKSTQEKLLMNNMMMKEQISTITEWHNQVTSSVATQQLHLKEVEENLLQCQKENAELKEKLSALENQQKADRESQTSMKVVAEQLHLKEVEENLLQSQKENAELREKLSALENQQKADRESQTSMKVVAEDSGVHQKFEDTIKENEALLSEKTVEVEQLKADYEKQKQEFEKSKEEYKLEILTLKEQLQNQTSEVQATKEIKNALLESQTKVLAEEQETETERIRHKETKKLLQCLQDKYEETAKELHKEMQNKVSSQQAGPVERQLLEKIDSLTAEKLDLEQKLNDREVEVGLLKSEVDTMDMLKTQVENYKDELNKANKDKEEAISHSQALTLQLVELRAPGSGNNPVDAARGTDQNERRGSQQDFQPEVIECPICNYGFTDITAAENHVNSCLDNDGHFF